MFILYDLIFLLIAIIYLPVYLFRRKFHCGFLSRFGILPKNLKLEQPVWVHAVSVGEAIVVKGLIEDLRKNYPDKKFVISTVTTTGNKIAQTLARENDLITYLPLDFSFIVKRVINKVKPSLFIIAETEIWPNLISYLAIRNIPIIVVNGRISDSSFRGYSTIKFLLKSILNKVNLFCVQTERDAQRLMNLGVAEGKVKVTGNMKFDITDYANVLANYTDLRGKLGLTPEEKLLVAGSTHPGEERIILNVYKDLLKDYPSLRLLIAPRHCERAKDIEKLITKYNFQPLRISQIDLRPASPGDLRPIFILDTIGQLINYYAVADIVFVGGSLVKTGGHNILEPAFLGKPILFGPYMFNFRDISELFLKNQAAILVRNGEEFKEKVKYLLDNLAQEYALNQRTKELILGNQGATKRNLDYIKKIIPGVTDAK